MLRHEIVHAVASVLAPGPLRLPARAAPRPDLALVEGLAVALESPRSGFTVHQWSRAARDLGFLPDLGRILGPAGLLVQAPARAYTAAGSFLAYLLQRYGPRPGRRGLPDRRPGRRLREAAPGPGARVATIRSTPSRRRRT